MIQLTYSTYWTIRKGLTAILFLVMLSGCEPHDTSKNSPTSGSLILYVDETYVELIRPLADSFTTSYAPAMSIDIKTLQARDAVEELINQHLADTSLSNTAAAVGIIIGRELLEDERRIIGERNLNQRLLEIPLAWDGLALVVPNESPLKETTVAQLREALITEDRRANVLQEGSGNEQLRFVFTSPNSSSYGYVREHLLKGDEPASPARWLGTADSAIDQIANGEGIGLMAWYRAHQDSVRLRTLKVGYADSTGIINPPVRVHTVSLVMDKYPMKLHVVGYSLAGTKSPANGFLSWLASSDIAQQQMAKKGLEPENVRFTLIPSQ
ncbi:MAG: substrate-binding domain-containing protein [Chlorobi bacterium]|nr:substrate-binding domain-containing protein [Chlorobiota bacterium]